MERNIENKVVGWATANGWTHLKLNVMGRRGWPDQLFIAPGAIVVFMEFKDIGKSPRPLQRYVMTLLNQLGCHVTWKDDAKEAIEYLERIYKGERILVSTPLSAAVLKQDDDAGRSGRVPKARKGKD